MLLVGDLQKCCRFGKLVFVVDFKGKASILSSRGDCTKTLTAFRDHGWIKPSECRWASELEVVGWCQTRISKLGL